MSQIEMARKRQTQTTRQNELLPWLPLSSSPTTLSKSSDNIDWSFIHPLVNGRYSLQGAEGYDPISLFKAHLLIYLGEVNSDRKLAISTRSHRAF